MNAGVDPMTPDTDKRAVPSLRAAAEAYLGHIVEAAQWPTPGIGCDGNCTKAADLRAALAAEGTPASVIPEPDEWGTDLDVAEWLVWYARKVKGKARDVAQRALDENPALRFSERAASVTPSAATTGSDSPERLDQGGWREILANDIEALTDADLIYWEYDAGEEKYVRLAAVLSIIVGRPRWPDGGCECWFPSRAQPPVGRAAGLAPDRDASDGLELRDAPSASLATPSDASGIDAQRIAPAFETEREGR